MVVVSTDDDRSCTSGTAFPATDDRGILASDRAVFTLNDSVVTGVSVAVSNNQIVRSGARRIRRKIGGCVGADDDVARA